CSSADTTVLVRRRIAGVIDRSPHGSCSERTAGIVVAPVVRRRSQPRRLFRHDMSALCGRATKSFRTAYEEFAAVTCASARGRSRAEASMRIAMVVSLAALLVAPPAFAQSERGYITGVGGFTNAASATSADVFAEGGVRVAPHLSVFGDLGTFHNLAPSNEQASIASTVATLSTH